MYGEPMIEDYNPITTNTVQGLLFILLIMYCSVNRNIYGSVIRNMYCNVIRNMYCSVKRNVYCSVIRN